ncbi:MAG TPA: (4Fe-4S)-binding protein [Mycobacteriales bacterium]|jgi:uncharacterized Fe-S cluster protein YjdI/CDGSH-type Zn-finger protein|nr:(4Fe-4S)-binding protein [Mycobacteriales bacterium]
MTRKTYRGDQIEVSFDFALCIHVGACLLGLPEVFELGRRPWILPDEAEPGTVAEVVHRCPSGALQYRRLDGAPDEQPPSPATVTPLRDGPLLVTGAIEVAYDDGRIERLPRATLCRCGLSKNKPFCDNSHLTGKFKAPGGRIRISRSPVRPQPDTPIPREADPRR